MRGQILQFGYSTIASNFEPAGNFYDNASFGPADCSGTGGGGPSGELTINGDFEADTELWVTWPGYVAGGDNPAEITSPGDYQVWIGIDPSGGRDPFAKGVAWGQGAHIYNSYAAVPAVEATAKSDTVTVFTRARACFPYKHNDAYWDDAHLVAVDGSVPPPLEIPGGLLWIRGRLIDGEGESVAVGDAQEIVLVHSTT